MSEALHPVVALAPLSAELPEDPVLPLPAVPCIYCRGPIAPERFAYWSGARRLVSARCTTCERRMTLLAATWRRWVGLPRQAG